MKKVGIVGWRGMVGSVLMQRLNEENDFANFHPIYFSTSQAGQAGPDSQPLQDANDISALAATDVIITCQGGDYTKSVHGPLRATGWDGFWIDAASALRMEPTSVIVLDPVNRKVIDQAIESGVKDLVGGNCTVSLMLLGVGGLFEKGWIEWLSSMTYQSASGAGAQNMKELVSQMQILGEAGKKLVEDPASAVLDLDKKINQQLADNAFPIEKFGAPLAASLIPWIDCAVDDGQTREEWKGFAESNKILGSSPEIPIDGQCVRVGAMRCHSQGLTIKLNREVPLNEIEAAIEEHNDWVRVVPNNKEATLAELTPAAVTGTMKIPVGRIRKMNIGPEYVTCFTVGDQLLWGAAEPIRRALNIVLGKL